MSKEFDTSWFDLNNYAAFETMSLEEWHYQLTWRRRLEQTLSMYQNEGEVLTCSYEAKRSVRMVYLYNDDANEYLLSATTTLKNGNVPCVQNYFHPCNEIHNAHSFSTASVNSIDSCDMHRFRTDDEELYEVWASCEADFNNDVPFDFQLKKHNISPIQYAHVQLNLSASDEQLKNDFNHWLKNYRKETGITSNKKYFSQSDLDKWFKFCAIPYLDLLLIAEIEGKKITQHRLANLIFPNEFDVDIVGRLRDTTKPMAEMLKNHDTHTLISLQVANEKVGRKTP